MAAPVTTFIFDLGGVLVRHDNAHLFDRLAACCADPEAARRAMAQALDAEPIATGGLSIPSLHAQLAERYGFDRPLTDFLDLWSCHFSPEPGMEALIDALLPRYRVAIFSNTNAAHIDHIRARYPAFAKAHAAYLSYELGLMKPRPEAYLKVLELEGRAPQECVFVDDRAENTAAAATLGMKTATFSSRAALEAAIAEYGVVIDA